MSLTIYESLEDGIITALAPVALLGVDVVLFPDDESEFEKTFARSRISVSYHSFTGGDQLSASTSVSEKVDHVQIMFEAKKKRGALGIYDLEVRVEALLNGLIVPPFKRLTPGTFNQGERNRSGVWVYNLIIKTESATSQTFDDTSPTWAIPGLP